MAEPSIIGKYRIEGRLGQGGMGAVYLARDARIGRLVALKVLRVDNEEMRNRFELEAQSAGRLKHPNIVTIYDYEEYDGNPCLVMEYVEGHTLADMIQRGDPLPMARRLEFVEQVCRGLAYAHAAGIVHRDVKPSNLMVDQHGVVKILDFGIARNAERGLTRSRRMVGTAGYMSPEQVRGDKVDQRCDVFAVGLVLYEFLTGRRAFPGENEYSVFDRILNGSPDPFDHPDPRVIDGIRPILETALARQAGDRYQSVTALGTELAILRQRFEAGVDSNATVVTPAAARPVVARPPVDAGTPRQTPPDISPDHTPTRAGTRLVSPPRPPARVSPEPVATPNARRRLPTATLVGVAAIVLVIAGVAGVQYGWPFMTGPPDGTSGNPAEVPAEAVQSIPQPASADPGTPAGGVGLPVEEAMPTAGAAGVVSTPGARPGEGAVLDGPKAPDPGPTLEARRIASQRVAEGQRLFSEGQYDAAIKVFEAVQAQDPADQRAGDGIAQARRAKAAEDAIMRGRMRAKPPS